MYFLLYYYFQPNEDSTHHPSSSNIPIPYKELYGRKKDDEVCAFFYTKEKSKAERLNKKMGKLYEKMFRKGFHQPWIITGGPTFYEQPIAFESLKEMKSVIRRERRFFPRRLL